MVSDYLKVEVTPQLAIHYGASIVLAKHSDEALRAGGCVLCVRILRCLLKEVWLSLLLDIKVKLLSVRYVLLPE